MFTAYKLPDVYQELSVDTSQLGCLMIHTENPFSFTGTLEEGDEYYSPNYPYVKGLVTQDWHATVRHGFLPGVKRKHVDRVAINFGLPKTLTGLGFEVFPSVSATEEYECVVLRVSGKELVDLHLGLGVLPNIMTFPEYKPHITFGYFRKGWYFQNGRNLDFKMSIPVEDFYYGETL